MVPHRGANNAFFPKIMENHHKALQNGEKNGSILASTLGALLGALGPLLGGSGASLGRLLASLGGSWVVFGPPWAAQDRAKKRTKIRRSEKKVTKIQKSETCLETISVRRA